tara:strand:+ start:618 stop:746 length:129 start_codon:yes stop_codon:yes gene_type:complete
MNPTTFSLSILAISIVVISLWLISTTLKEGRKALKENNSTSD